MLDKLIEARKRWNQLSDCIYEIGAGDLDNSRFSVIYQNFEDVVLDHYVNWFGDHEEFLENYFCGIVLDIAEQGYATFICQDAPLIVRNEDDFEYLLMCGKDFEYQERSY